MQALQEYAVDKQHVDDVLCRQHLHVLCFYVYRQMMAPLMESIVLLDRYAFLCDHNEHVILTPLFDEHISPRTLAVIAYK
jgi:hypothetical protein